MPAEHFDVVFRGHVLEGQDPSVVQQQIGQAFHIPEPNLKQMFSGRLVVLKKAVDIETASRYQLALRKLGAVLEVRASVTAETSDATSTPKVTAQTAVNWSVTPPNTGTLEDCTLPPTPAPIPDIQHLTIATTGVRMDQTPPISPREIDTGNLNIILGETWTLEDCQTQPQPVVIDTQNLDMLNEWTALDEHEPPTPPHIDTSALDVVPEENWTLKDCQPPPPPPLSLNLNGLSLSDVMDQDQ